MFQVGQLKDTELDERLRRAEERWNQGGRTDEWRSFLARFRQEAPDGGGGRCAPAGRQASQMMGSQKPWRRSITASRAWKAGETAPSAPDFPGPRWLESSASNL